MPKISLMPGEPQQQLRSLVGAEKEARAIAQILDTKAFIGSQAAKATIVEQLPRTKLIHLATHGLLDDIRGLESAIVLAPSGNDAGLLTSEEILGLKLNATFTPYWH